MHGLIPFKLYDYQEELINDFNDYRFNVILKARQLGISTITAGYVVWLMMFHRDKNILVMATKFSTAGNLVKKVKAIIKHVPAWIVVIFNGAILQLKILQSRTMLKNFPNGPVECQVFHVHQFQLY